MLFDVEHGSVAPNAAAILRGTGSLASGANRIDRPVGRWKDFFDHNIVPPIVAEVVPVANFLHFLVMMRPSTGE